MGLVSETRTLGNQLCSALFVIFPFRLNTHGVMFLFPAMHIYVAF